MTYYVKKDNVLIKKNYKVIMLYIKQISPGIILPKIIDLQILRFIAHKLFEIFVLIFYVTRAYQLRYKDLFIDDNSLLIINGKGKWKSRVKLKKINNRLIINKTVNDLISFRSEKKFYKLYKNNKTRIKISDYEFKDKSITYSFINAKSLQRQILEGTLSYHASMQHFYNIKNELKKMYSGSPSFIHGDLAPLNIFFDGKGNYYLIDFSDSHTYLPQYDLYVLLYSILFSYNIISVNEKSISKYNYKGENIKKILGVDINMLNNIETHFIDRRNKKHPGLYYTNNYEISE